MIRCDDCVAYAKEGGYYLYSKAAPLGDYTFWAQETGIWMPKDVAPILCTVKKGFDQPAEYNMEGSPIQVPFSYMCCNECAKHRGGEFRQIFKFGNLIVCCRMQVMGLQCSKKGMFPEE